MRDWYLERKQTTSFLEMFQHILMRRTLSRRDNIPPPWPDAPLSHRIPRYPSLWIVGSSEGLYHFGLQNTAPFKQLTIQKYPLSHQMQSCTMFPTLFAITWVFTISVVVEVPVGVILHTGLYGTDQFLLLQLAVEGAMSPIGK